MSNPTAKRRSLFTLELRGQEVDIDCFVTTGDQSVGLQADFEDEVITGDAGVLDWELTDDERIAVNRHIDQCAMSMMEDMEMPND